MQYFQVLLVLSPLRKSSLLSNYMQHSENNARWVTCSKVCLLLVNHISEHRAIYDQRHANLTFVVSLQPTGDGLKNMTSMTRVDEPALCAVYSEQSVIIGKVFRPHTCLKLNLARFICHYYSQIDSPTNSVVCLMVTGEINCCMPMHNAEQQGHK